ncbi:MAG: putative photosynthetic complex assembly protein PuhE [Gammaproteobacteria bacterium]
MSTYGLPVLYVLLLWWFSTGVVLYLDGLPRRTHRWSLLGATAVALLALFGLRLSSTEVGVIGAFAAFTGAVLVWGWLELSFLTGIVTGPRKHSCLESCAGGRHFLHGVEAILYHELALIGGAALIAVATWDRPNQVGTWTFLILWGMRASAKLNLFLGVRNLSEELLPEQLQYLKSFFSRKPMNLLFPVSVTVSTIIATRLLQVALANDATAFEVAAFTLLSTLMGLAVLEHWFLVLPLPANELWRWGLRSRTMDKRFKASRGDELKLEIACPVLSMGDGSANNQ